MSSVEASTTKEKAAFFSMVLSSPGMADSCKIVLSVSRQNVLLLSRLIETGFLNPKSNLEDELLKTLPDESAKEFKIIHEEILKKSGLTDFYEKLKSL